MINCFRYTLLENLPYIKRFLLYDEKPVLANDKYQAKNDTANPIVFKF
jgi:hypothetical protein